MRAEVCALFSPLNERVSEATTTTAPSCLMCNLHIKIKGCQVSLQVWHSESVLRFVHLTFQKGNDFSNTRPESYRDFKMRRDFVFDLILVNGTKCNTTSGHVTILQAAKQKRITQFQNFAIFPPPYCLARSPFALLSRRWLLNQ